jgi:glycosyltransferase involved in cell wall biosynthesis
LSEDGWHVHLVAQGELPPGQEQIIYHRLPASPASRCQRIAFQAWRAYRLARGVEADVYHLHDPELIPVGLLLKFQGEKVIYDVHEDVPRDVLTKNWMPPPVRATVSFLMMAVERLASSMFDGIVAATPTIAKRFPTSKTICVRNVPRLSEFTVKPSAVSLGEATFVYIGLINRARGLEKMMQAAALVRDRTSTGIMLDLAGPPDQVDVGKVIQSCEAVDFTRYHGCLDRTGVAQLLSKAQAGLVVLQPMQSFRDSLPVKMFEYMAVGIPVIASDFPLWREIVEEARCGLLVNPLDSNDIARAMRWIVDNPAQARAMGERGRAAVQQRFNWEREAPSLLGMYKRITGVRIPTRLSQLERS